ncbi:MAG: hypothetical protein IJ661_00700 [Lachnospiraceae bacterium]|nr:hypothetical protein [Lachnospiraceae bacterium]
MQKSWRNNYVKAYNILRELIDKCVMGICCKLAGIKYDLENRYPLIMKLERRMCTVERELNRNNPCLDKKGKCGSKGCR